MDKKTIFCSIIFLAALSIKAQNSSQDSAIVGIWKGTSICQIKSSPCHDEINVYHISKVQGIDSFNITANKIVNGIEEDMGVLGCKLDRQNNKLVSTSYNSLWTFNFKDNNLDGTLYVRGELYRIIKLKKQPK